MIELIKKFMTWAGLVPDYEEEEKNMVIAEKLEEEYEIMKEEDKKVRNIEWTDHIIAFYDVIKERRLELIMRRNYRESHRKSLSITTKND